MKIMYFSWIREKIGKAQENLQPPNSIATAEELMDWLAHLGPAYSEIFGISTRSVVRVAVNLHLVDITHAFAPDDEIAFFPPVTGG